MKLQTLVCLIAIAIFANVHVASAANDAKAKKDVAAAKADAEKKPKKEAAKAQRFAGKVTAVDADKNTITVRVGKKNNVEEKEFKLSEKCRVMIDGEKKAAADVQVGARAVIVSPDGQSAKSIMIGAKKKKEQA